MTLKPEKETNKTTPFCHIQKQPTIFHQVSVFCLHTVFVLQLLCFSENTIKLVFSDKKKTQLFNNTVKPTFSPMSKNNVYPKKRCHFWFWAISAETTISIVFPILHCLGPKKFFGQKQIVCTKMRVFSPFLTQIVSGNF